MSRPVFLNKFPGQSIFRGATSRSFVMVCLVRCLLLQFFLHCFYLVVSSLFRRRGNCAMAPPLETPWRNQRQIQREGLILEIIMFRHKNSTKLGQIQGEDPFLEITIFWDKKLTKPRQIQSCKFSLFLFD